MNLRFYGSANPLKWQYDRPQILLWNEFNPSHKDASRNQLVQVVPKEHKVVHWNFSPISTYSAQGHVFLHNSFSPAFCFCSDFTFLENKNCTAFSVDLSFILWCKRMFFCGKMCFYYLSAYNCNAEVGLVSLGLGYEFAIHKKCFCPVKWQ